MKYKLLENHRAIRDRFVETYIEPFSDFCASHREWISGLHIEFTQSYYESMFMWDRLCCTAEEQSFDDALRFLREKRGNVIFLTESADCDVYEFCALNSQKEYAAVASAAELAECAAYEWYTSYELFEQGRYLKKLILPSDLYIFDETFSWCLILTHETDESESADSRYCLFVGER